MKRTLDQLQLPSPLSSQHGSDTIQGNEVTPHKDETKRPKLASRKVQSILGFPSASNEPKSTTCAVCGMCYYHHFEKDRVLHSEYHANCVNGIPWVSSKNQKDIATYDISEPATESSRPDRKVRAPRTPTPSRKAHMILVDKKSKPQVARVEEILAVVNRELNASPAADWWKQDNTQSLIQGRAFVIVINGRTVGICITDPILDTVRQCRWMIHSTQKVVARQVNKRIKVGVSRIWVCHKWRRRGLANLLLDAVLSNSLYGTNLSKDEIGFSQPSFAGGLLAKSFNGVLHKSGEVLIPVYLEE